MLTVIMCPECKEDMIQGYTVLNGHYDIVHFKCKTRHELRITEKITGTPPKEIRHSSCREKGCYKATKPIRFIGMTTNPANMVVAYQCEDNHVTIKPSSKFLQRKSMKRLCKMVRDELYNIKSEHQKMDAEPKITDRYKITGSRDAEEINDRLRSTFPSVRIPTQERYDMIRKFDEILKNVQA